MTTQEPNPLLRPGLTRRQILQAMGFMSASMILGGCATTVKPQPAPSAPSAAGGATAPATPKEIKLNLTGWNFQPEQVRAVLDKYQQSKPGTKVEFTAHASAQYNEKALAMFLAKTPMDVVYGRDGVWPGWADAGYILPVDDLPGLADFQKDMIPFNLEGTKYKGKTWGIPYYGDFMSFGVDAGALDKIGMKAPPATWAEMKEACLAMKQAGLFQAPLMLPMGPSAVLHWWTLVFGSGGDLFDGNLNPVFANGKDDTARMMLEWMVQAANDWKILDLKSVEGATDTTRTAFAAGQFAFATTAKYDFKTLNDKEKSKIAGRAKAMLVPAFAKGKTGTCGWSRIYCLSTSNSDKTASWDLIRYLGSAANARDWYLKAGIGYAYASLDKDPQIVTSTKDWGDVDLFANQSAAAKMRQGVNEPWFNEWETFNQQQIQNALLKRVSAKDALAESARKVDEVKKKYSK